jgi:hypothetical protein
MISQGWSKAYMPDTRGQHRARSDSSGVAAVR